MSDRREDIPDHVDRERFAERIAKSLLGEFEAQCRYRVLMLQRLCESPIEVILGAALWMAWDLEAPLIREPLWLNGDELGPQAAMLYVQHPIMNYRADFFFRWRPFDGVDISIAIECDGHDFHEKTKEQAARDKARDREIQSSGVPVLRFTGSEIYRNSGACAAEVIRALQDAFDREMVRQHGEIYMGDKP